MTSSEINPLYQQMGELLGSMKALQDKVDRCERARDGRVVLAGLTALPGALLLAIAILTNVVPTPPRRHDAPSPVRRGDDA